MQEVTTLTNRLIGTLINPFLGVLAAAALAVFIWGIIDFIANADNEEARTKGRRHIIWGIAGLVIMFSAWGIIAIIQNFVTSF